jgi:hypothetical protein
MMPPMESGGRREISLSVSTRPACAAVQHEYSQANRPAAKDERRRPTRGVGRRCRRRPPTARSIFAKWWSVNHWHTPQSRAISVPLQGRPGVSEATLDRGHPASIWLTRDGDIPPRPRPAGAHPSREDCVATLTAVTAARSSCAPQAKPVAKAFTYRRTRRYVGGRLEKG